MVETTQGTVLFTLVPLPALAGPPTLSWLSGKAELPVSYSLCPLTPCRASGKWQKGDAALLSTSPPPPRMQSIAPIPTPQTSPTSVSSLCPASSLANV